MVKVNVLVLYGFGINCDYETKYCFDIVNACAERVHLSDLINKNKRLEDYHIFTIPGGFSFGDDIASAKILANKLKYNIIDDILDFIEDGKLILGICNGFQVMVKMGLLPAFEKIYTKQLATLTFNDSGRFEDRWVYLKVNRNTPCIFTKNIKSIYLPVRHGEGKFFAERYVIDKLFENNQIVMQYTDEKGKSAGYPFNPNGSLEDIAGICDPTGRVFGLMPHPEAYNHFTNHPRWTREKLPKNAPGLKIFRNAVKWIERNF